MCQSGSIAFNLLLKQRLASHTVSPRRTILDSKDAFISKIDSRYGGKNCSRYQCCWEYDVRNECQEAKHPFPRSLGSHIVYGNHPQTTLDVVPCSVTAFPQCSVVYIEKCRSSNEYNFCWARGRRELTCPSLVRPLVLVAPIEVSSRLLQRIFRGYCLLE